MEDITIIENEEDNVTTSYLVKLENFEGPLDLLLHLIKDAKMDIASVKLADITEQYLKYMEEIQSIDMEKASEFITVAATLIEIKSKSLLPKIVDDNPEEEDSEQKLLRQLKEYKLFKEASEKLHNYENVDRLYKMPDKSADKVRVVLTDFVFEKLLDAFVSVLARVDTKKIKEEPKKIVKDRFTVADKIVQIRQTMLTKNHIMFTDLFDEDHTKSELINIFLALLELLKLQIVRAIQNEEKKDIDIFSNINGDENGTND